MHLGWDFIILNSVRAWEENWLWPFMAMGHFTANKGYSHLWWRVIYVNLLRIIKRYVLILDQCLTTKGIQCKFPFIYKRKRYNHCVASPLGNWCATEVDSNLKMKRQKHGRCNDNCPTADTGKNASNNKHGISIYFSPCPSSCQKVTRSILR